jgi:ABC-2 type transport system permease protein
MTTMTAPVEAPSTGGGSGALHLIRAEYRKIRTTNSWWIFAISMVFTTGLALFVNILQAHLYLTSAPPDTSGGGGDGPGGAAAAQAQYDLLHQVPTQAANIFTSGQFFGGMFAMLLAILIVTNEYHHQTATTTFLTTPHRTAVIGAKFIVAMLAAAVFWVITTVLDLITGIIYFKIEGFSNYLGDWTVQHAILVNLMVFALWGVFGIGLGVLIRSQLGATITSTVLYVAGSFLAGIIFTLIRYLWIKHDWVLTAQVILPAEAARIAVAATKAYPQAAPWWVGVLVLLGYGILTGILGTLIMRKRDIS